MCTKAQVANYSTTDETWSLGLRKWQWIATRWLYGKQTDQMEEVIWREKNHSQQQSTVVIFSSTLHIHSWIRNFFPLSISSSNILHSVCSPSLKMLSSAAVIILFAHCQKCHNTDCYTSHWSSNPQKPELITNPHASKPRQVATLKKGDLILGPRELLTLHGGVRR